MAGSRWKIQLINGSEVKELLLNTEPLPTWPFGTLGDVGKINVLSTRNFKVESTPESDVFFEYMGKFNVVGTIQKRENFLTLLYDNEPVIENARVNKLSFENNQYSIILSGDNGVLIKLLNSDISTLNWDSYSIDYTIAAQDISNSEDPILNDGFIYSYSVFDSQVVDNIIFNGKYFLPAFKLETIFNEILSQNSLLVTNLSSVDFQNNDDFKSLYYQLPEPKLPKEGRVIDTISWVLLVSGEYSNIVTVSTGALSVPIKEFDESFYWIRNTSRFVEAKNSLDSVTIDIVFNQIANSPATLRITNAVSGEFFDIDHTSSLVQSFTFSNISAGDYFAVFASIGIGSPDFVFSFEMSVKSNDDLIEFDRVIYAQGNLPEVSQIDIIKLIANRYALLVDFDTVSNSIVFYDYTNLISKYNSSKYIDITGILVNPNSSSIDESGSLAISNNLDYDNDSDLRDDLGRGTYSVNNVNLPNSKTVYKAPFSYSRELGSIAIIPYTQLEDNTPTYSFAGLDNYRLVDVRLEGGFNYSKLNYVDFQYIVDTYYTDFNASNEDFKILSISILADWTTIKEMVSKSEKLPIFIDYNDGKTQINGVFKLNKISNWSDKKPTRIELKKLL